MIGTPLQIYREADRAGQSPGKMEAELVRDGGFFFSIPSSWINLPHQHIRFYSKDMINTFVYSNDMTRGVGVKRAAFWGFT